MNAMTRLVRLVAGLVLATAWSMPVAEARSCSPRSIEEEFGSSTAVVLGRVVDVTTGSREYTTGVPGEILQLATRIFTLDVEREWKGPGRPRVSIETCADCTTGARFAVGDRLVVFAAGEPYDTSSCSRSYRLADPRFASTLQWLEGKASTRIATPGGDAAPEPAGACAPGPPRDSDVDVYRAALGHSSVRGHESKKRGLVVVREMSPERSGFRISERDRENFRKHLREPNPALIASFLCVATGRGVVPAALGRDRDVQLVSEAELQRTLERPGRDFWRLFNRRYPRAAGLVSLSPVAYSADGAAAMLHVAFASNALIGHGEAIVLKFVAGAWYVVDHVGTWVS